MSMNTTKITNRHQLYIQDVSGFNLKWTLESGQSFRWNRMEDAYYGVVEGQILKIHQCNDNLIIYSSKEQDESSFRSHLMHYLDLQRELAPILSAVNVDAYIERAINKYWGMRLLNQELWETIASFIISQNNNMARIRGIIRKLAERFGERLAFNGYVDYTFPTPQILVDAGIDEIFLCGTGYRAKYLWNAANNIANGVLVLDVLKQMKYEEAKQELMKLEGVGEKVADCICLFSLGHLTALPVDVWIKRIFERIYLQKRASPREIQEFARNYFGQYVGYAQQYLFHYAQNQPNWADDEHLALSKKKK